MKICFLGAGKMAEAIISAAIDGGVFKADEVIACDISEERRAYIAKKTGCAATDDAAAAVKASRVVVLGVRPQDLDTLLASLKGAFTDKHLVLSICAGKTLKVLRKGVGRNARLVRIMPNLALRVRRGMVAYTAAKGARPADLKLVRKMFGCAGTAIELAEKHFDAVTALSGSGPAFFAYTLKAMTDGGVKAGLPADAAALLASQTMLGTIEYLISSKADLGKFIEAVCSKGGTTEAGMKVLAASDAAEVFAETLAAAAARSAALA